MGCKTRRSKHLFKSKKSLKYRNKKKRTRKSYIGGGEDNPIVEYDGDDETNEAKIISADDAIEEEPVAAEKEEPVAAEKEEPVAAEKEEPVAAEKEEPIIAEKEEPVAAEKEQPVTDMTNKTPKKQTMTDNFFKGMSVYFQVLIHFVSGGLDKIADTFGLDSSKPALQVVKDLASKLAEIAAVLGTPEADQLKKDFSDVASGLAESIRPAVNNVTEIAGESVDKILQIFVKALVNAVGIVPGVGEMLEAFRVGGNLFDAWLTGLDALAKLSSTVATTTVEVKKHYDSFGKLVNDAKTIVNKHKQKLNEKASDLMSKGVNDEQSQVVNNEDSKKIEEEEDQPSEIIIDNNNKTLTEKASNFMSNGLSKGMNQFNKMKTNIGQKVNKIVDEANKTAEPSSSKIIEQIKEPTNMTGGASEQLSHLQKAGKKISDRLQSTLKEFNNNHNHTKKHKKQVRFNI